MALISAKMATSMTGSQCAVVDEVGLLFSYWSLTPHNNLPFTNQFTFHFCVIEVNQSKLTHFAFLD